MRKLCGYSGDDDFSHGISIYPSPKESGVFLALGRHVDVFSLPCKRSRISAPFVFSGEMCKKQRTNIEVLPDQCLFEIFRRLSGDEDKSSCASVSKRWLMILSTIRRDEISQTSQLLAPEDGSFPVKTPQSSEANKDALVASNVDLVEEKAGDLENSDGYLSRCLEGKRATDIRLAAIAVGTGSRGGLGKLSIHGNNASRGVTNFGLKAIARGCPSLRTLSLWNLSSIGDEGLVEITNECHMLEKLDLCRCPTISDKSLLAVANNCPNLTSLSIESCSNIGNEGLQAIGRCCSNLKSISIRNCPLVGDPGIASLLSSTSYSLTKVKLQDLNISDVSLAVIGHYGIAVTDLSLVGLHKVTEKGFWVMGNGQGLQKLRSLAITSCCGVTDLGLEAVGKGCPNLKQFCLRKCAFLSDNGVVSFAKSALSLEGLVLEECHRVTQLGIFGMLVNCGGKLKTLSLKNCFGIKDLALRVPIVPCNALKYLSICDCPGFGNFSLTLLGRLCPQLQNVEFSGLHGITDDGLAPLIQNSEAGLVKVNLSGCVNLTDTVVSEISRVHGGTLEVLNLNGCRSITDASLASIVENCLLLAELDISECTITDSSIEALAHAAQLNLRILSISGCYLVSDKSLPFLVKLGQTLVGLNIQQCRGISSRAVSLITNRMWKCDILS